MSNKFSLREAFSFLGAGAIIFLFLWLLFFISNPLSAFLLIFGLFFTFFVFINPLYGFFALLILRPTLDIFTSKTILTIRSFSLNLASLLGIISIILAAYLIIKNSAKLKKLPLKFPIVLFLFIIINPLLFAIDGTIRSNFTLALTEWMRILSIFSLYAIGFILIDNLEKFKKLIWVILFSILIPGLVAFFQFFTQTGMTIIDEEISNRIYGTFAHPNLFAYYLVIPLSLGLFLFLNSKKSQSNLSKNSHLFFSLPIFILLMLTYTRGAWMVFLAVIFVLGIFRYRKFLLGILLGLILIYFIVPPLHTRVNNLFEYNPYSSIQWRINLWKDSLKYAQEKFTTGYGLGSASKIILDKRGEQFGSSDPHNDYLKILLENGIPSLLSYLILIIALLIILLKKYFQSDSVFIKNLFLLLIGISFGLYAMSFADNVLRNTALQWVFWSLIGATFSLQIFNKNKK